MQHALELTDADWDFNFAVTRGACTSPIRLRRAISSPRAQVHRQHRLARRQGRRAAARPLFGVEIRRARLDAGAARELARAASASMRSARDSSRRTCSRARSCGRPACARSRRSRWSPVCRPDAARPAGNAGGCRRRDRFSVLRPGALHDRAGGQRHRRGLHDLRRRRPGAGDCDELLGLFHRRRFRHSYQDRKDQTATTAIIAPGTIIQPVRSVRTWAT